MFDLVWAQAGGGEGPPQSNMLVQLVPFALIFVIFYFLLIRPQVKRQKAHAAMVQGLSKGDKVVTNGGLVGVIVGTKDDMVVLKIGENTKVEVLRSAVSAVRGTSDNG